MEHDHGNLLDALPEELVDEVFDVLVDTGAVKIERIVSRGHVSPPDGWYDQSRDEWVLVLSGAATVVFEDGRVFDLSAGDYLSIPARVRHRVAWTDPDRETVWLAVHHAR